ncbi:MAG: PIN domain-containing protein [bacterium]
MATKLVLLDTGILGMATHPTGNSDVKEWLQKILSYGYIAVIPEICDYELRRELLRAGKYRSIARIDTLKSILVYLPIDTSMMLRAAEFWAEARKKGMPTADDKALDADAILSAQAVVLQEQKRMETIIATTNIGHISRFTQADIWMNIK